MAEQVVGLRVARMRRPCRDDPGGQQAGGGAERPLPSIVTPVRWLSLPWVATSVADTMATPSAEPHCRVAVSSALAVPSDRAATGPQVPGQGGGDLAEPGGDAEHELTVSSPASVPPRTEAAAPARASSAIAWEMASARRGPSEGTSRPAGPASANAPAAWGTEAAQAGEHRAQQASLLQVQGRQQDLGGAERADRDQREGRAGDAAVLEQRQVEQRRRGPALACRRL